MIIEKGQVKGLKDIFQLFQNGKMELERKGIFQWTDNYPTVSIIEEDLKNGHLYILKNTKEIIGAISLNEVQDEEYQTIDWGFNGAKILVIHRLVIHPSYQRQGHAKQLMDYAEDFASANNYSSIRLDAYSQNKRALEFYRKRDYLIRGNVHFSEREHEFYCMEKEIKTA